MKTLILIIITFGVYFKLQAQPLTKDKNWNTTPFFIDNFNPPRSAWDNNWFDCTYDCKWRAHLISGVTHGPLEHQVYQRSNAIFNSADSTIKLRATYEGQIQNYELPPNYSADTSLHELYYKSGAITEITADKYLYGYFEAKCKLPVNRGAFPAFWLQHYTNRNYREIDIFEHSWGMDTGRKFNGGIWYCNDCDTTNPEDRFGEHFYTIPQGEPDLTAWHIYALEWSPKRVLWYFDNMLIGEYFGDSVPTASMYMMLNYAVDDWVKVGGQFPSTGFPSDMTIDYVKVHKLKCDCNTDVSIQNNSQLTSFDYQQKKTISVGGYGNAISISTNESVVLRATDGITINADFEVPLGSELELTTHPCAQ